METKGLKESEEWFVIGLQTALLFPFAKSEPVNKTAGRTLLAVASLLQPGIRGIL